MAHQSFVLEVLLTGFLMFVVLSVSTGAKEIGNHGRYCGRFRDRAGSVVRGSHLGSIDEPGVLAGTVTCVRQPESPVGVSSRSPDWRFGGRIRMSLRSRKTVLLSNEERGVSMKRVIFVCVENSNRSQMAEAFARIHGAGTVEAHSRFSPFGKDQPEGGGGNGRTRLRPHVARFKGTTSTGKTSTRR